MKLKSAIPFQTSSNKVCVNNHVFFILLTYTKMFHQETLLKIKIVEVMLVHNTRNDILNQNQIDLYKI